MSENELTELLKFIEQNPALIGLAGSLGAFITSLVLLFDDAKDFGEFSSQSHPSPLHHWQVAIPTLLASIGGLGLSILDLLSKQPPPKPVVKLPLSLKEQGAPEELIEAFK